MVQKITIVMIKKIKRLMAILERYLKELKWQKSVTWSCFYLINAALDSIANWIIFLFSLHLSFLQIFLYKNFAYSVHCNSMMQNCHKTNCTRINFFLFIHYHFHILLFHTIISLRYTYNFNILSKLCRY